MSDPPCFVRVSCLPSPLRGWHLSQNRPTAQTVSVLFCTVARSMATFQTVAVLQVDGQFIETLRTSSPRSKASRTSIAASQSASCSSDSRARMSFRRLRKLCKRSGSMSQLTTHVPISKKKTGTHDSARLRISPCQALPQPSLATKRRYALLSNRVKQKADVAFCSQYLRPNSSNVANYRDLV